MKIETTKDEAEKIYRRGIIQKVGWKGEDTCIVLPEIDELFLENGHTAHILLGTDTGKNYPVVPDSIFCSGFAEPRVIFERAIHNGKTTKTAVKRELDAVKKLIGDKNKEQQLKYYLEDRMSELVVASKTCCSTSSGPS